jgi:hypothetical protein
VVEGLARGGNRAVDIRGRRRGNITDRTFGVRGDDRQALLGGRLAPSSSDEKLVVATVVTGFRHGVPPLKGDGNFAIDANIAKKTDRLASALDQL